MSQEDWSAGANRPRNWEEADSRTGAPPELSRDWTPPFAPSERVRAHEAIERERAPLGGASLERLQLARDTLARALIDGGVPVSEVARLSALCVLKLQEPLS